MQVVGLAPSLVLTFTMVIMERLNQRDGLCFRLDFVGAK